MRVALALARVRGGSRRNRCGSARYHVPSDDPLGARSLSSTSFSLISFLSFSFSLILCSEPAFRRHGASYRTPADSHFPFAGSHVEPMPRVRRDEGETGVVLLIAHNHAFHPRTPRPRPRRPFLSSTRKLVRCTILDGCTAPRSPLRTLRLTQL